MKLTYDKLYKNVEELKQVDRTNEFNVAGLVIHTICEYNENEENFYDMLQFLLGEYQPLSNLLKQQIKERFSQNNKASFIGKSYFVGATPENNYEPVLPYIIEVLENDYSRSEEGYARLLLTSGGADSSRFVTVRKAKDGNWYLWSDSILGLLSDIRIPESENPWA